MTTSISRSPTSTSDQFDIGAIMSAPAKDPRWLSTCLVMGLLSLIPVVGALNLSGWSKAIAERDEGDTSLPEANLSYLGRGWHLLLAWLPLVGDPLCAVAGWLRLPFWPCVFYMAIGKFLRYVLMTAALLGIFG